MIELITRYRYIIFTFKNRQSANHQSAALNSVNSAGYNDTNRHLLRNILDADHSNTTGAIQPALKTVSASDNNSYEQEADSLADKMMTVTDADLAQSQQDTGTLGDSIQRVRLEGDNQTSLAQPLVSDGVASDIKGLKSSGTQLPLHSRAFFDPFCSRLQWRKTTH
jgi:hypothetical protein